MKLVVVAWHPASSRQIFIGVGPGNVDDGTPFLAPPLIPRTLFFRLPPFSRDAAFAGSPNDGACSARNAAKFTAAFSRFRKSLSPVSFGSLFRYGRCDLHQMRLL